MDAPLVDGGDPDSLHAMLDVALAPADPGHGRAGEGGDGARGVTRQPGLWLSLAGVDMGAIFIH